MMTFCRCVLTALVSLALAVPGFAGTSGATIGLVLGVDVAHRQLLVSCQEVPSVTEAKVLQLGVRDPKLLTGVRRGSLVDLMLAKSGSGVVAQSVHIHKYESAEREPSSARRLRTLDNALNETDLHVLMPGQTVPDFALVDQKNRIVRLQQFRGKLVLLNFVYTRCALPNYCFRLSNNFGVIQRRERTRLGRELILLTVTFDPVHDRPEVLLSYAKTWNADPESWRFLTGGEVDVQRVCARFGVNVFPNEGLFVHSMHTALIDREGKLIANLEGNQFTAQQLADLVEASLNAPN